ncbi:NAD(P)-dependent oxidoreductase [Denitromonas iodatirespirans]|uniref:NAD(P)-dependent oxidoreductase n=1 Tax=Denitromonas iodatirespirans TaxID=2795389 RepID=A0A944DPB5_DENI1|nr:NAD(P)-dependent oxidoreductase [Denitromonas iodatirespirans]MBT0962209.1 NAD(P)-dependent oxidoreductase [Denitromonas iodatirespirans]
MRVGIIGIGNMGLAMALNLRERGVDVTVRDLCDGPETIACTAGATVADSPAALAAAVDVVITVVGTGAETHQVLLGPDGVASIDGAGRAVMICSTIAPNDVIDCAAGLARAGWQTLDAPISGGPARARDGGMSMMLGGDPALVEALAPLLAMLAKSRFVIGPHPGDGAKAKLVNNLLAAVNLAAAGEAFALAERLGLDAKTVLDVVCASSGQSWITADRIPRALAGDFAPRAHARILTKDIGLALDCARAVDQPLTLGAAAQAVFQRTCALGWAEEDDAAVLKACRQSNPG